VTREEYALQVLERVEAAEWEARQKAWRSLAGYKFWMFGYHAAQWVFVKRILGLSVPNPFRGLVKIARRWRI